MFLATTALSEFWNKKQTIVFLGHWCLRYDQRKVWGNLNCKIMDYPWNNRTTVANATGRCNRIYEFLMSHIADCLNSIHRVNFSKRYWKIVVGPWLLHFVHVLYDRYTCLKIAFQQYPDLETICLSDESFVTPTNLINFKFLSTDDPYNQQLYSQLISLMGYSMPRRPYSIPILPEDEEGLYSGNRLQHQIKNFIEKRAHLFNPIIARLSSRLVCQSYLGIADVLTICIKSGLKILPILPLESKNGSTYKINHEARQKLLVAPTADFDDSNINIFMQMLPQNCPLAYIEMFPALRRVVQRQFPGTPEKIISSTGWFTNESFKILAAEKAEVGALLMGIQHGGQYGYAKDAPSEKHEIGITDNFFSWGWKLPDSEKVIPLPSPMLSSLAGKGKRRKYNDKAPVLHVSNIFPRYLEFFRSVAMGSQVLTYLKDQFTFIRSLPPTIRENMIIRPYPFDEYAWQQRQRFKEQFPDCRIDDRSMSFPERLQMCSLVVCGDNQTTFLQTMALNIPSLLFVDPSVWTIRDEAMPYFDELKRVGIFVYGARRAAAALSEIYKNPGDWWFSQRVQEVRRTFVNRFALGDENWLKRWLFEINT